jgi:hypothetical protein
MTCFSVSNGSWPIDRQYPRLFDPNRTRRSWKFYVHGTFLLLAQFLKLLQGLVSAVVCMANEPSANGPVGQTPGPGRSGDIKAFFNNFQHDLDVKVMSWHDCIVGGTGIEFERRNEHNPIIAPELEVTVDQKGTIAHLF